MFGILGVDIDSKLFLKILKNDCKSRGIKTSIFLIPIFPLVGEFILTLDSCCRVCVDVIGSKVVPLAMLLKQ